MQSCTTTRLQRAQEHRERQIAEAAEHRRAFATRTSPAPRPVRRAIGRALVRLGSALANECEPTMQPARPR